MRVFHKNLFSTSKLSVSLIFPTCFVAEIWWKFPLEIIHCVLLPHSGRVSQQQLLLICETSGTAALYFYIMACGLPIRWRLVCWHLEQNNKKVGEYRCQHPFILIYCQSIGHCIKIQCCRPHRGEVQAKLSFMFIRYKGLVTSKTIKLPSTHY